MGIFRDVLAKVKRGIEERRLASAEDKLEKQQIETEAKELAHEEYLAAYRSEKIKDMQAKARARAKRDATSQGGKFAVAGGFAKELSGMGKRLLDSGEFNMPSGNVDFGFGGGFNSEKKRRKKKKRNTMYDLF